MNPHRLIASQLLASTVQKLFPNTLLINGQDSKLGFFYDFLFDQPLPGGVINLIEMELRTLVKEDLPIRYLHMMRENAESFFQHHHQPLLADLAASSDLNIIELIQVGPFTGICPATTIQSTSEAGSIKLLHVETDESKKQIRIIGTVFPNPQELKKFTKRYDYYLKKKDHRFLGPDLNLFSQSHNLSEIEWFWHPKGLILRDLLQNWAENKRKKLNYERVSTPTTLISQSKKRSVFAFDFEEQTYILAHSRLRQHFDLISRSGRSLPIRLLEYCTVYAREPLSDLWGLFSARSAWTDQATALCAKEELHKELISSLHFIEQIIRMFGFEANWVLIQSRRKGSKGRGEKEAIRILNQAIAEGRSIYPYRPEPIEQEGLIGTRLELRLMDEIGRDWPGGHVSIEMISDCKEGEFLVSSSLWGSLDRIVAMLIERYEGELPVWLAPEQVRLLAVGKGPGKYAEEVCRTGVEAGLRITCDTRDIKLGEKVHEARKERVPYVVVIGEQEVKKGTLTVQSRERLEKSIELSLDELIKKVLVEGQHPDLVKTINGSE